MKSSRITICICFVFSLPWSSPANAEEFDTTQGVGLRLGPESGITLRKLRSVLGYEFMTQTLRPRTGRWADFDISGIIQVHYRMGDDGPWSVFGGLGVYARFMDRGGLLSGLAGHVGVEYTLNESRWSFLLDWKPRYSLDRDEPKGEIDLVPLGLSIRYLIPVTD